MQIAQLLGYVSEYASIKSRVPHIKRKGESRSTTVHGLCIKFPFCSGSVCLNYCPVGRISSSLAIIRHCASHRAYEGACLDFHLNFFHSHDRNPGILIAFVCTCTVPAVVISCCSVQRVIPAATNFDASWGFLLLHHFFDAFWPHKRTRCRWRGESTIFSFHLLLIWRSLPKYWRNHTGWHKVVVCSYTAVFVEPNRTKIPVLY